MRVKTSGDASGPKRPLSYARRSFEISPDSLAGSMRQEACRRIGQNVMTVRGGVNVIPEEVRIGVDRALALRGRHALALCEPRHVCQGIFRGRGNYAVQKAERVQLIDL